MSTSDPFKRFSESLSRLSEADKDYVSHNLYKKVVSTDRDIKFGRKDYATVTTSTSRMVIGA